MPEIPVFLAEDKPDSLELRIEFLKLVVAKHGYSLNVIATATTMQNALRIIGATEEYFFCLQI